MKVCLFGALPAAYFLFDREKSLKALLKPDKKGMITAVCVGFALFAVIWLAYLSLGGLFDLSAITDKLGENVGVNKENFIYISLYIAVVNSFLEEFFFRGFAFLTLKRYVPRPAAYVFSALCFALYHVSIMDGWFSPWLLLLLIAALFAGGIIFNYLDEKFGNIYVSWFAHGCCNLAINSIGFVLFDII